jgi:hypothetical protein
VNRFLALAAVLISSSSAEGQSTPITITTEADILWTGVDRPGDLFLVLANGDIQKFDKTGKKIGSHKFSFPPTLLDPLDGVQSFYYQRKGQRYGNMSYDFSTVSEHTLDPSFAISPWLVCPALRELWILDSADFSIRKTSLNSMTISLETALQHLPQKRITDYTSLREYQNYVFLLDKTAGVHVFNSIGKFVRTLGEKGMIYFNFLGEEMYYVSGNTLVMIDLYTLEKRILKLDGEYQFALLNDEILYGIGTRTISILPFKP